MFYLIFQSSAATPCGLYSDTWKNTREKACRSVFRKDKSYLTMNSDWMLISS